MRYFIELSYDGTAYHGWQVQPNANTVQQQLEMALSTLLRHKIAIVGAGRTDTGVHAQQMWAHFNCSTSFLREALIHRLNRFLPTDIAIKQIRPVPAEAHARFDAVKRTYEYRISTQKNPYLVNYTYHLEQIPDIEAMNNAAKQLLKHNDFKCFSKSKTDVHTFNCNIDLAFWEIRENTLIFTIRANRFLRNMVRAIVGTLLEVGFGKCSQTDFTTILKSGNRSKAGPSVPASGLFLTEVTYPKHILEYE